MLDGFDTVEEHAKRLDRSVRTIYRMINRPNGLPYTKRGREYLLKPEWTQAWYEAGKTQRNPSQTRRGRRGVGG